MYFFQSPFFFHFRRVHCVPGLWQAREQDLFMALQLGLSAESISFQLRFILSRPYSSTGPGTLRFGTSLVSPSLVGFCALYLCFLSHSFLVSAYSPFSRECLLYGKQIDTAYVWEIFLSRSKAPEDIIMEVALGRGIEDGSSCQGYADSSGDRLPFQTHDPPPPPTRTLFFTKWSLQEKFLL